MREPIVWLAPDAIVGPAHLQMYETSDGSLVVRVIPSFDASSGLGIVIPRTHVTDSFEMAQQVFEKERRHYAVKLAIHNMVVP